MHAKTVFSIIFKERESPGRTPSERVGGIGNGWSTCSPNRRAPCGIRNHHATPHQLSNQLRIRGFAAGCSTVWGASAPAISYTTNSFGRGPAWGFSLFEDNAEYGFGMHLGVTQVRQTLAGQIREALQNDMN